jgi:hypothetical protein
MNSGLYISSLNEDGYELILARVTPDVLGIAPEFFSPPLRVSIGFTTKAQHRSAARFTIGEAEPRRFVTNYRINNARNNTRAGALLVVGHKIVLKTRSII